jgi:hypothetical protein
VDRQVGQEVPHAFRPDARVGHPLPVGQVRKEAPCPVGVAAFGAMRVVPGSDALPKLLERWQRIASALLVDDGTHGLPMPVRPLEEVHEVDAQCLLRLTYLPFLTPPALELLAEQAHLVGQRPPRNPRAMPPAPFRGSRLGTRPEGALSMPIVSKAAAAGQCSPDRGGDQARQMSQQRTRQIGAVQPYDVGPTEG